MTKGAAHVAEKYAWEAAGWEWTIYDNLNSYCDKEETTVNVSSKQGSFTNINSAVKEITCKVNGEYTHLDRRNAAYYECLEKLFNIK